MRDDPAVVALVDRARSGDQDAWNDLVDRYAPLVWSVCRRFRLAGADADDVGQSVWLRLVEHLPRLREPAALPGWLATTTRRECLRLARAKQRKERIEQPLDTHMITGEHDAPAERDLIEAERNMLLRAAFGQLPEHCRRLLTLLMQDPPLSYAEASARLGTSIGSIGPTRARCLRRLRDCPAFAALADADT
ncbi:RNA polymerase sigma factor [Actinomadura rubrisoli]|uniref:Sigma-70 family RNA polymerase sigma factor n=1 Tax=Actinomadura rubrisoli TaxID=2530368 RepID=A0A4R5B3F6_9ACTN|nr:sigma-70 family RNA polymerase sigma factor [Actinomadura rubrisoli]TDD79533.1 sigma-70 family RNA polymerase sigma factor [Actinomadura rubrisoli]